jgi:hypothetical protein
MFSPSVLNPMSPQALAISKLFVFILIAAGANLLGLVGTLAITLPLPLYRHRKGQGDPPPTFGRFDIRLSQHQRPRAHAAPRVLVRRYHCPICRSGPAMWPTRCTVPADPGGHHLGPRLHMAWDRAARLPWCCRCASVPSAWGPPGLTAGCRTNQVCVAAPRAQGRGLRHFLTVL